MERFKVLSPLALPAGSLVALSDAQAAVRKHALEPVKGAKAQYRASAELSFKAGEVLGLHQPNLKVLANVLQPMAAGHGAQAATA